jgi:Ca-activated chloride channel family protein
MVFENPFWLFGLFVLPALVLFEVWARRRDGQRLEATIARSLWPRLVRRSAERWRFIRLGLVLLGTACLLVAIARPQWGIVRERVEREGADVILALDTSASMGTQDVAPSRFFLARQSLLSLVSWLGGDRIGLLAFEGEAYPLAPLTLDADAVGLFLESIEPGIVPSPGTSLGAGLARGLAMFVDAERRNKVLVLVSDGEDLEGQVEDAVTQAKQRGVVVHTVGVGTETGQPVPETDNEGHRTGYKRDESGQAVVSRLDTNSLQAIARGTGGQFFRITSSDSTLASLATAIESMDRRTLATEYSYRRKERFQIPLAAGLACFAAALALPLPSLRRRQKLGSAALALLGLLIAESVEARQSTPEPPSQEQRPSQAPLPPGGPAGKVSPSAPSPASGRQDAPQASASAHRPGLLSEILLRPRRRTASGRTAWEKGDHPTALRAFEEAAAIRPDDPAAKFNVADGLYKNGRYDEAAPLFRELGQDERSPLAASARHNLGNALFQRQDFKGAIGAYRDALHLRSGDPETRRNLELALRALEQQQKQEQQKKDDRSEQKDQKGDPKPSDDEKKGEQKKDDQKNSQREQKAQKTKEEREKERFENEAGMPKERAEQLLAALERNEAVEQKKQLAAKRAARKGGKDW